MEIIIFTRLSIIFSMSVNVFLSCSIFDQTQRFVCVCVEYTRAPYRKITVMLFKINLNQGNRKVGWRIKMLYMSVSG